MPKRHYPRIRDPWGVVHASDGTHTLCGIQHGRPESKPPYAAPPSPPKPPEDPSAFWPLPPSEP
jgi:hypothetical protein